MYLWKEKYLLRITLKRSQSSPIRGNTFYISINFLGILFLFLIKIFVVTIFISFLEVLNFRNRILTNQKPEYVIKIVCGTVSKS